jgi:general secretion pathway protein D
MSNYKMNLKALFAGALAVGLLSSANVQAQFGPGGGGGPGFGGFGGFGGANRNSRSTTRQYPNNGTVGDAVISIDPETHQLVVIADDETKKHIAEVIASLDKPKPQVLIKVVFVEVTHNNSSDIGIEGGFTQTNNSTYAALANAFGLSGLNQPATGSNAPLPNVFGQPTTSFNPVPPGAGLYQVFASDYQVTLRAIATAGKAKILSRPSIVARNNQPASILVGQTVPLITSVRYDSLGNAINGITYTDVGIILRVTPFITEDGMVQMILSPETSAVSPTDKVQIQNATFAPVIDKRSADTVVVTPDGQTVIIGGLMHNQKTENDDKIPVLGDIPLVGNLFKHKTKAEVKTELLIFLTPHIIRTPSDMAALSDVEKAKYEGMKSLTEKELNKFLDQVPSDDSKDSRKSKGSSKSARNGHSGSDTGDEF